MLPRCLTKVINPPKQPLYFRDFKPKFKSCISQGQRVQPLLNRSRHSVPPEIARSETIGLKSRVIFGKRLFERRCYLFFRTLKTALSILLLSILISQPALKIGVIICWKINQKYIVENHCINRKQPEKHCDGKCYLSKQLQNVEERDDAQQQLPFPKLKYTDTEPYTLLKLNPDWPEKNPLYKSKKHVYRTPSMLTGYIRSLFHPPERIG